MRRSLLILLFSHLNGLGCAAAPPPLPPPPAAAPSTTPAPVVAAPLPVDPRVTAVRTAIAAAQAARGRGDFAGSERVLGDALLADETSAPLLTELALHHLAIARAARQSGRFELARAVAERAIAAAPAYAPAHLARGWIASELGEYAFAAASFERAGHIDPALFEAHLAAAELRLRLRDLAAAEAAYRAALRTRPDAYEARVGLARTLRARVDEGGDAGWEARLAVARHAIDEAIALRPERPEAYLGAAVLAMDQEAHTDGAALFRAGTLLNEFLVRAQGVPGMETGEREARLRLATIDSMVHCRMESERVRKDRELQQRIKAAEEEANAPASP